MLDNIFTGSLTASLISSGFIATLLGVFLTQWFDLRESKRKSRQDLYFRYSSRYTALMAQVLEQVENFETAEFKKDNSKLRKNMVELFMLLSEEFYLHQKKLVDKDSWQAWERNIDKKLQHKIFRDGWAYVREQMNLKGDFGSFIESKMEALPVKGNKKERRLRTVVNYEKK